MRNGKWEMGNGKWEMLAVKWEMGNGERRREMVNRESYMGIGIGNGERKMESRKRR
jgi:hypothetical protein